MERYGIAQEEGGAVLGVIVQEEFPGGPPTGAVIPADAGNRDWQAYLEWLDEGNEPDGLEP